MVSVVPFTFLVGDSNLTEVVRPAGQSLVTTNSYDAGGFLQTTKDPFGVPTFYFNDALGQPLSVVKGGSYAQAFGNSVITTGYQYNAVGDVTRQTVLNWQPGATAYNDSADLQSQVTIYAYGGIGALDKSLLTGVTYSAGGSESLTYDNLDNTYTRGDRSGNVHQYSYDAAGRGTFDAVTSFGPGVDQTVKAIGTSFDALGDVLSSTSYSNAAGTGIVNQVSHAYNGFAQLMADYENATGAAPTTGSPSVQYAYYESNNDSRLTGEVYPDGRVVAYGYGGSTVDGQISRIDTTSEGTTSGSGTSLEQASRRQEKRSQSDCFHCGLLLNCSPAPSRSAKLSKINRWLSCSKIFRSIICLVLLPAVEPPLDLCRGSVLHGGR